MINALGIGEAKKDQEKHMKDITERKRIRTQGEESLYVFQPNSPLQQGFLKICVDRFGTYGRLLEEDGNTGK